MEYANKKVYEMYEMYLTGESMQKVADVYQMSHSCVHRAFKRHKLPRRSNRENSRIYDFNHDYFEKIDTEEKAYWLGFMYADGYVSRVKDSTSKRVGIAIGIVDRSHLEKFNSALGSTYPINEYEVKSHGYKIGAKYCRLLATSSKMFDDLVGHGCVENKTNILERPPFDNKLTRHFIRGYIDGDGSITRSNRKWCGYEFGLSILGNDDLLVYILNHFIENGATDRIPKLEKRKKEHKVSNICYGGNYKLEKLLDYLYSDSNIYLDRKYERYLELKLQNCRTK